MKRNIFIVITMTLLLAVLSTGCTSTTPTSAPTSTPVPTSGAEYTLPIVEPGSVTLTISTFDNWYVQASYKTGLPVWKEIEKRTGITIEWDVLPDSEYGASLDKWDEFVAQIRTLKIDDVLKIKQAQYDRFVNQ
jgi:putative aldouronate transport system substrate-binding protein